MEHNGINEQKDMEEFERKLRFAMRHQTAPLGMKQRVLARARERRSGLRGRWWVLQRLAASVVLAATVGGVVAYRHVEEQRKGEVAREQVLTALRITSRTLDRVGDRVNEHSADATR